MSKITIVRGDDVTLNLTFTDSNNVAYNLTGVTVFMTVKSKKSDNDEIAVISKTITNHTTPASGLTQVNITASETDIAPAMYVYDFQIKDATNKILSTRSGEFEVLQDVTQRTS